MPTFRPSVWMHLRSPGGTRRGYSISDWVKVVRVAAAVALVPSGGWAQTNTWINPSGGNWGAGANWSLGAFGNGDDAVFSSFSGTDIEVRLRGLNNSSFTEQVPGSITVTQSRVVTIVPGGNSTNLLRVGAGGITVERGDGRLVIETNVKLRNDQTWRGFVRDEAASDELVVRDGAGPAKTLDLNGKKLTVNGPGNVNLRTNIVNAGQIEKRGVGTLFLTGSNSFTGGITVSHGDLDILSDAALGSGPVQVNGATLRVAGATTIDNPITFDNNAGGDSNVPNTLNIFQNDVVLAGAVAGGQWAKRGNGTLTLTGPNSSALMHVAAGNVEARPGNHSPTITTEGAAGVFFTEGGIYNGSISGAGGINKVGGGVVELRGVNTPAGTTIAGGGLQATTTSLDGPVLIGTNQEFYLSQNFNGTYEDLINGGGALVKQGTGVVTLTAANSYSRGTHIQGGAIAGNTSSLQGDFFLSAGTSLLLNETVDSVFTGRVLDDGGGSKTLRKQGGGRVILGNSNIFTGTLVVEQGTLVGDATSLSQAGSAVNIAGGGTLELNSSGGINFGHAVSGAGRLLKNGAGNLNLTGSLSHTGGTQVSGGSLTLQSTLPGPVAVGNGAALGGSGVAAGSVSVLAGGVVDGGITFNGPVSVESGGLLRGGQLNSNVMNHGSFEPVPVVGQPLVHGTYTQSSLGRLLIPIGTPDVYEFNGMPNFAGTLELDTSAIPEFDGATQYTVLFADAIDSDPLNFFSQIVDPARNLRFSARIIETGSRSALVVTPSGSELTARDRRGDVNGDGCVDDVDARALAAALFDPFGTIEITDSDGGRLLLFDFANFFDIDDRGQGVGDGVIDFDDVQAFAEVVEPCANVEGNVLGMIGRAIQHEQSRRQAPEPSTLVVAVLLGALFRCQRGTYSRSSRST